MTELPTIETRRLVLRPFRTSDATEVQRLAGNAAIASVTLNIPHPYGNGVAESWIATHAARFATGELLTLAIVKKQCDILVGAISLMDISPLHQGNLGYWIGVEHWNQGFCTEAAQAVLDYAFGALDLVRVHSMHLSRNPVSGRVMQKLGMQHEGRRRQHVKKAERLEDIDLYGILKQEWLATKTKHSAVFK